ncbi:MULTISPECIES: sensor histidine kinase [Flavobacteriaceae]|uniref:sensor histidine kinase n=1 Tax=Flavobacteriaceae TaxID=49546 RepID=UPI0014922215|nr:MULTISPECIES: histidine kinase [Allomuricauda]MDC6364691.1 histidine kinase [Muricauda sp. AC10]
MGIVKPNKNLFLENLQKREVFIHLVFWMFYLFYPYIKSITSGYTYVFFNELINLIFGMVVFYVTYLLILPSKNKIANSILLLILFFLLGYVNLKMHNAILEGKHEEPYWYYGLGYFSAYAVLALFGYVLYSIKKAYEQQQTIEKTIIERQQAELSSLKAQIYPHFLFNTLNMIYSSALKKDDKTPEMILKLSDNFRYLLQKGQDNSVNIQEDIIHIRDYVSLQKERLANKIQVNFSTDIDDENQVIAPLLFLPFIENAFKYVNSIKGSQYPIYISVILKGKTLTFECENPFNSNSKNHMDKNWQESGIGIENTKKRLDYFYKDNYQLHISKEDNIFRVLLKIQL